MITHKITRLKFSLNNFAKVKQKNIEIFFTRVFAKLKLNETKKIFTKLSEYKKE
jgi:phosphotransferase system IIB component